jgi:hypothetical protein
MPVLVWRLGDSPRGNCPRCIALEGHADGNGWSSTMPAGAGGPPPLHATCSYVVVEEPTWSEQIGGHRVDPRHRRVA